MASSKEYINVRIIANDFEKKWDLHKGTYALYASKEEGLVFKGPRTQATISRQIIRQHGIEAGKGQHCYFVEVGRKSPYGEGRIHIYDTVELSQQAEKRHMTGAAIIGEWITNRVYTKNPCSPPPEPEPKKNTTATPSGKKWWEKDTTEAEYDLDCDIPLQRVDNNVVVEDTEDVYALASNNTQRSRPANDSASDEYEYILDVTNLPPPSPKQTNKKSSKKGKKKQTDKVMVEDTEDLYSLPGASNKDA